MSSGDVCTAIKPGSTPMYMWKTHFLEQQGQGMKGKVGKFQLLVSRIQAWAEKISQITARLAQPRFISLHSCTRVVWRSFKGTNVIMQATKQRKWQIKTASFIREKRVTFLLFYLLLFPVHNPRCSLNKQSQITASVLINSQNSGKKSEQNCSSTFWKHTGWTKATESDVYSATPEAVKWLSAHRRLYIFHGLGSGPAWLSLASLWVSLLRP